MTWPAADVGTTNADAGTDSPATARTDLLDLMTKFNQVRNHVSAFIQTLLDDAAASNARATLGAAASGANADITSVATTTTINGSVIGYREIPQNSQSVAYTLVAGDAGKHLFHPSVDTTARIWTIPANASVAFPIGTAVTFVNQVSAGVITIAITTDTMRLAGPGTTGSRTLAANGVATAIKVTATEWIISGTGLT